MLRPPPQPVPGANVVLCPGQHRLVFETPCIQHREGIWQMEVGGPQPKNAVLMRKGTDREHTYFFDRHQWIFTRPPIGWIIPTQIIGPRRINHDNPVRPAIWQWRRLIADGLGLSQYLELAEHTIHPPSLIHILFELAVFPGIGFGSINNVGNLLDLSPGYSCESTNLVSGLSGITCGNFPRVFARGCSAVFPLSLLRRRPLDRLQGSADGIDLAGQKILPMGVLGKFTPHNVIQIDDGNPDFGPAELLAGGNTTCPRNQSAVGCDDDRMQQAQVSDTCRQQTNVTQVVSMPVADLDGGNGSGGCLVSIRYVQHGAPHVIHPGQESSQATTELCKPPNKLLNVWPEIEDDEIMVVNLNLTGLMGESQTVPREAHRRADRNCLL